jgi:hypothetical protein
MTLLRRPDGSGGPLAADERIDDIQYYVEPHVDLRIDDIVLCEAAAPGETEPFPRRIVFTGWFDTGKQGAEWPGDFEIVPHQAPRTWKAARSVPRGATGVPWIRVGLRGERPLGGSLRLRWDYRLQGAGPLRVVLRSSRTGEEWTGAIESPMRHAWGQASVSFRIDKPGAVADELLFLPAAGAELLIDDVLLYEPEDGRRL